MGRSPCGDGPGRGPERDAGGTARLTDWLTREEWNACYFLGLDDFHHGGAECGACGQVRVGMRRLGQAGYRFRDLSPVGPSGWEPDPGSPATREHGRSCAELGDGSFDHLGRAREAIAWLRAQVPAVSTAWLEQLVALYDRTHGVGAGPA